MVTPKPPLTTIVPQEPVLNTTGYVAFSTALADTLVSYGVPITSSAKDLLIMVISLGAVLVHGLLVRSRVFSPDTVARISASYEEQIAALRQMQSLQGKSLITPTDPEVHP